LSYASPGYLPCFFQKSNITFELKRCQGKNAGTRVLAPSAPPANSEFRLDLSCGIGVSFLCDGLPRPREIERK